VAIANLRKVAACSVRYFLPGTIWFPLLPVTTRYPALPVRLRTAAESVPGEKYKSELKARGVAKQARDGSRRPSLGQQVPALDEMKPAVGETDDDRTSALAAGLGLRRGRHKPIRPVRPPGDI
jgi:hypothetical protein